jgi:hypothetical protein
MQIITDIRIALSVGVFGVLSMPAFAADYNCVPLETSVFGNRAHVLCAEPAIKTRGSYPVDTGHSIRFLAVPLSDKEWAGRFIRLANIAETSGLIFRVRFTSGDYSGESFGCVRQDCRTAIAFFLLKSGTVP